MIMAERQKTIEKPVNMRVCDALPMPMAEKELT